MSSEHRILVIDDEVTHRDRLTDILAGLGYKAVAAANGEEGLQLLDSSFDLVMVDLVMPGMSGYEVIRRIRSVESTKDLPIVITSTDDTSEQRLAAVEVGASDFIGKPLEPTEVEVRTASLLRLKRAQDAVRGYQGRLEGLVRERTARLVQALAVAEAEKQRTIEAHMDTVRRLVVAAEYRDFDTAAHTLRIGEYAAILGEAVGVKEVDLLRAAASMHDIGKIGVPDGVLLKEGRLSDEEREIMKEHTRIGATIVRGSPSPLLRAAESIALTHHERWDGDGYPQGLAGEDIPLWARICAVADVFDALTTDRPYRRAFPVEKALEMMREGRGSHFDPAILDVFFEQLEQILEISRRFSTAVKVDPEAIAR